ncbi:hypothetical protein Sjap_005395 [Stephania japonica]|uniref:Uncharacterized protein n=1 Tax=Stephania japonica TaxID=461633 RepID=A0AAP0PIQ7_9MAGN
MPGSQESVGDALESRSEAPVVHKEPADDVSTPGDEAREETTTNELRVDDVEHNIQPPSEESLDDLGTVQDDAHPAAIKDDDEEEDNIPLNSLKRKT